MRERLITTAAILLALLGFATVQIKAEIEIVQADTVFQGFGGGSVSGIVFGPTGETVILMHDAQPVEINIKTKQIVREFEKVPNAVNEGSELFYYDENKWIGCNARSSELNGIKNFYGLVLWDYNTGKIINSTKPAVISNGKQFYTQRRDNSLHKQYFCRYDINTLSIIDSVEFDLAWFHGLPTRTPQGFGIIPNSNKIIIGANNEYLDGPAKLATLYVLDFDTKQCTEVAIPYNHNTTSSSLSNITVSETGKYFCLDMSTSANDSLDGTMFFNNEYKYLFTETGKNIKDKLGDEKKVYYISRAFALKDDYIISIVSEKDMDNQYINYNGLYNIPEKSLKKKINFDIWKNLCYNDKVVAMANYTGTVILINYDALPVMDNKSINTQDEAEYQNGLLTIYSETAEKSDINIIDYQGNTVFAMKDKYIQVGRNSISIDFPLSNGVYFAVIKTANREYSYKFLVSR